MKRVIAILLCCTFVVLMVACSNNSSGKASDNEATKLEATKDLSKKDATVEASETNEKTKESQAVETQKPKEKIKKVEKLKSTMSYVGWASSKWALEHALNRDKANKDKKTRYPLFRIDTMEDLKDFQSEYRGMFSMDCPSDDTEAFNSVVAKYDKLFFNTNSLLVFYVSTYDDSNRFSIKKAECKDDYLCIHITKKEKAVAGKNEWTGWLFTAEIPDNVINDYHSFDVVLDE